MSEEQERAEFEKWAGHDMFNGIAWAAWQARASLAQAGEPVAIRPLEWADHPAGGTQAIAANMAYYRVHRNGNDWYLIQEYMGKGGALAAEAFYERGIRSALYAAPPAPVGVDAVNVAEAIARSSLLVSHSYTSEDGRYHGEVTVQFMDILNIVRAALSAAGNTDTSKEG